MNLGLDAVVDALRLRLRAGFSDTVLSSLIALHGLPTNLDSGDRARSSVRRQRVLSDDATAWLDADDELILLDERLFLVAVIEVRQIDSGRHFNDTTTNDTVAAATVGRTDRLPAKARHRSARRTPDRTRTPANTGAAAAAGPRHR